MDFKILAIIAFLVVIVGVVAYAKSRPAKPHKGGGSPYNPDIDSNPK